MKPERKVDFPPKLIPVTFCGAPPKMFWTLISDEKWNSGKLWFLDSHSANMSKMEMITFRSVTIRPSATRSGSKRILRAYLFHVISG